MTNKITYMHIGLYILCGVLGAIVGAMWAVDDGSVDLQCYESEVRPIIQVP